MMPQKLFFGDIFYINTGYKTLAAFSTHFQPSFVSLTESALVPFRNAHFQIFPATGDPIPKLRKKFAEENIAVKQGSQILFYHVETKSFLAVTAESDNPEAPKKLIQVKSHSEATIFKITHPKSLIVEGNEILYDESLEIFSEKLDLFLAIGGTQSEKVNLNVTNSYSRTTNDFPRVMPRRNPHDFPGDHHIPIFDEIAGEFKLTKYKKNEQIKNDRKEIMNGDYVRIRYVDKWMSFYPNQDKKKEIYFENVNDRFQPYNYIHTIFQIIDEQSLQADNIIIGNSKQYILKHFVTGSYIHFDSPTSLKAQPEIHQNENETPYCYFETEASDSIVREKLPLRINFPNKQGYEAFIKPTEPVPVKNVQFEINTLYFFGFKVPEEYSYKNQKNLTRVLAELSSVFEVEGYNVVLEKVDCEEMEQILEIEEYTNELQSIIDHISVQASNTTQLIQATNQKVEALIDSSKILLNKLSRSGKIADEEDKAKYQVKKYRLEVADKHIQALIREFRVFDLIHMTNFLFIKKAQKNLEGDTNSEKFGLEKFLELYETFANILLNSLNENIPNRFYNSQYIRIYIHFMSDSCEGVFKKDESEVLVHRMRRITLKLLKMLLWDDDLDGLGQLNFYQTMIFNAMKGNKNFETYYLELLEHISSSKAYNLINSFRDAFITTVLTCAESFKATFPLISVKNENQLFINFQRNEALEIPLEELKSDEKAYSFFIVALRVIISLSTSKFVTFYHQFIKHYPLNTLQEVLKHPNSSLEIKMLVHLVILYVYFDYMKLPFSFIPPLIQTSTDDLRQVLNQEEKKIVNFCKTSIGEFEQNLLNQENIAEEISKNINNFNTQGCSQQISLLESFLASELNFQSAQVALFYIQATIHNGNITIHFLNKAKEVLIFIRKTYQNVEQKELEIMPELLEIFALVNQKMKTHSTIALYNQVIKTQNPNAEVYSRKIISGLKKIHLDSFAPLDMIALNEPVISGVALGYLKDVAKYENNIADELDKFVILSSSKDVETLKETIDIALTLNQNTRKYYVQKEIEGDITLDGQEYVQNIELLERLLTFIYNPSEHFLFQEENVLDESFLTDINNPSARFFRILRKEKIAYRDQPFLIQTNAVSRLQQSIFALLSIHDILLKLLNCTITLTVQNKPADAPADVYQARLILVILIAFVRGNKSNQDLLAKSHGFISLYYQQKYIDKSCDTLTLFAEVMRDNRELLEISKKFIYDITCYTFLGTIKPRAINKDSGAYLCTAIMSMHYLHKADIPLVTYDTFSVAEGKFDDLLKNDFPNLNLLKKIQEKIGQPTIEIDLPACYYNIREMLEAICTVASLAHKEGKKEKIDRFRERFTCQKITNGFLKPDYRFQFEIKKLILQCIDKMNFGKNNVNTGFVNSDNKSCATNFFAYLINELLEFLLFSPKNSHKEDLQKTYEAFTQITESLEQDNEEEEEGDKISLKEVRKSYSELTAHKLSNIKQTIFMDELSISVIWEYLYIFSECWKFVAKFCVLFPEIVQASNLFEVFLNASEQLVLLVDLANFGILKKLRKYFTKLEDIQQYDQFKEKIKEVKESIVAKQEALTQEIELKNSKKQEKNVDEPTEKVILQTIIEHMRATKQKDIKANLDMFSQILSSHNSKKIILSELLTVIEYNPLNLSKEITAFVASFVNLYLEKTLPQDLGEYNESLFESFYKAQQELSELDAEKRLVGGIALVKNSKNMKEIFKLILTFSSGYNLKVIEKIKRNLIKIKRNLVWSERNDERYEQNVTFMLEEILRLIQILNDNELNKFLEYCIKSHKETTLADNDERKAILSLSITERSNLLKKKMQSFFQEYSNKDKDEVYKELGPLPVDTDTLLEIFRVSVDDTASLKIAKHTILKIMKENDLKSTLNNYFYKRVSLNKEDLQIVKIDGIQILDLFITKIKYGTLLSE